MYIRGDKCEWEFVIGLETHVQIKSKSKLFSRSSTPTVKAEPNQNVDILDAAIPGTLPVLNEECVIQAVKAGHAINATINKYSAFDRKNYFYPDLPKGYQISQFYHPIVTGGYVEIETTLSGRKKINIERIHIEEDAGKSIHDKHPTFSLIDLNRAGVGLLEIVSKPEISSPQEAVEYAKNLRLILMFVNVNDGDLENGSFRCDANVSVRKKGDTQLGTRREIKNLNSFTSLLKAIEYEGNYQVQVLEQGGVIKQDTLLFDINTNSTKIMRSKENANDYRYFPDPDLPPLILSDEFIKNIKDNLPELPEARRNRYMSQYGLNSNDANLLTSNVEVTEFFEQVASKCNPKLTANWIITEIFSILNARNETIKVVKPESLISIITMIESGAISGKQAKEVMKLTFEENKSPEIIVQERGLSQVSDTKEIETLIKSVLNDQEANIQAYKNGNNKVFGFLVGQILKASGGKANPSLVNQILTQLLKS